MTQIVKPQRLIIMKAARNRLLMLLSVAPEEMRFSELIHLGKSTAALGDWEIIFRVNTLYGLKKVIRHFDRSGLTYEFELEV